VVAAIRRFKPDVIITRFAPDEPGTHAHHTTSALLAVEAFTAAADPARFPEQLTSLSPWQATRVVWNWFTLGAPPAPDDVNGFLPIEVGGYDALLGESYPEMAARSLTMHRTQGFGSAGARGSAIEYFRLLAGAPMLGSPFDGIDRTWTRVPGSESIDALLLRAEAAFAFEQPYASVPVLLEALAALDAMADHPWKEHKQQALAETIAACAALHVSAHVDSGQVTPGSRSTLRVSTIGRSPLPLTLRSVRLRIANEPPVELATDRPLTHNVPIEVASPLIWPDAPGEVAATVDVDISVQARTFTVSRPIIHSWIDSVVGERWEPVTIVPTITVNPQLPVMIVPDTQPRTMHVRVRASIPHVTGVIRAEAPAGVRIEPRELRFSLDQAGAEQRLSFTVHDAVNGIVRFSVDDFEGRELVRLDYPHIPPITVTRPAEVRLVRFDMARAGERVGYISGAGDEVAQSLRQAGYDVTSLNDDAIEGGQLSTYDAIVTGIRAFNTSRHLAALMPRLLAYVEGGGTLVVQYNTNTLLNALTAAIGPYPFTIGEDRVCEEDAEVRLRDPEHPVFTRPNRIGPADFTGWVQERGLCFSTSWDKHYTSLISLHDAGEPPRDGGLLVTTHGAGRLVYTGLAFFRQLPAGVPGAYRLFANLMAR
jgi:hypothetical protein